MYFFLITYFIMGGITHLIVYPRGNPTFYFSAYLIFILKIKFNYYFIMFYLYPNEYDDMWHCPYCQEVSNQ